MSRFFQRPVAAKMRACGTLAATAVACMASGLASAQTSFGSGTEIILPLAVNISVYSSQVFVRNPNPGQITLNVRYYQSNSGTAPSGLRPCAQLVLQGNETASFDMATQCGLNNTDDNFGMFILDDAAGTNEFFAYSRTQTPDAIGFSVEGFPADNFSSAAANVLGLKKVTAAPNYRSNCFVAALENPVDWQIDLVQDGTEAVLGTLTGSLGAFETVRVLDVFSAAGLVGDFSDVRAQFTTSDVSQPTFVGYCTLETSSNGSADFRIAKSMTPPPTPVGPPTTPTATWTGQVATLNANQSAYVYLSPTTSVTLAGTSVVTAYGSGWFARNVGGAVAISVGVCSQDQSGPGPVTLMPSATNANVGTTLVPVLATGSASLPAGSYNVGLCGINNNAAAVNKNGDTTGFVFVTP